MQKNTSMLYESWKCIYGKSPFISGLMLGGKADYLFGSAFLCVMNMKKYVCGVQDVLFFLMYSS